MPIFPLFALLGQTISSDEVAKRFDNFYKAHPAINVSVAIKSNSAMFESAGTMSIGKPGMRIDIIGSKIGYLLVLDDKFGFEAIPLEKSYAEFGSSEDMGKISFRMTDTMADLNLDPLIIGTISRPGGWTSAVHGAKVDTLKAHMEDQVGTLDMEADIDPEGRLCRVKSTRSGHGKTVWIETTFSGYTFDRKPASTYEVDPPVGWTAVGLRLASMPIQPQEQAPERDVLSPEGRKESFKEMLGGRAVVAVLDAEWAGSPWGTEVLSRVEKQFKDAGIPMLKLLDTPGMTQKGYWSDPTGELLHGLNPQGSPTFFLFDTKSKLQQAFFAVSPREPDNLYKDIAIRLKELAQKQ